MPLPIFVFSHQIFAYSKPWHETRYTSDMETVKTPHPIRALITDLDGTLVGHDMVVSHKSKEALIAAREAGCLIVICTGRPTYRAMQIADQLHADPDYLVTCNGAVVVDYYARKMISRTLMPAVEAHSLVLEIIDAGIVPVVFEEPDMPGDRGQMVLYPAGMERGDWAEGDPFVLPSETLYASIPFSPVSVSAYGDQAVMRPLAARLRARFGASFSTIEAGTETKWCVETYAFGVGKQRGVERVLEATGILPEETLGIGDHLNDIEMIQSAGIGVAMANALPEARAVADWVTTSVYENGVAVAIKRFILSQNGS